MNIEPVIQTLLATVLGGAIVIATNWINARQERRKSNQEWYEHTYIVEGVDPLTEYFLNLSFHAINKLRHIHVTVSAISGVPVEALVKIQIILGDDVVTRMVGLAHIGLESATNQSLLDLLGRSVYRTERFLLELRKELLKAVPEKVRDKSPQIEIARILLELKTTHALLKEALEKEGLYNDL